MNIGNMYWHAYHAPYLCYWVIDYDARENEIMTEKPEHEREDRVKWFKKVAGVLPEELVQCSIKAEAAKIKANAAWKKADAVWDKAYAARDKANAAWDKTDEARDKADAAWDKADEARKKADAAWKKANAAWKKANVASGKAYAKHKNEIEHLHSIECPDCSWKNDSLHFTGARLKENQNE